MLGKLFHYELRSTARLFLPLFGALMALSLVNKLADLLLPSELTFQVPRFLLLMAYILMIAAVLIMCIVISVQRFYKNLLGNEGYLSFTLPVTAGQHLLAKALVSFLWLAAAFAAILLSVLIILPDHRILGRLPALWEEIRIQTFASSGMDLNVLAGTIGILIIVEYFCFLGQVYCSMALGQLSNSHKLLTSFGAYIATYAAQQALMLLLLLLLGAVYQEEFMHYLTNSYYETTFPAYLGEFIQALLWAQGGLCLLLGAVYFLLSRFLLSRRLNLE